MLDNTETQLNPSFLKKLQLTTADVLIWLCACAWLLLQVLKMGHYPGINLDAMNPDYRAIQWLFPHAYGTIAWMASPPFLAQIYHGIPSAFLTLVSVIITGSTSVLQHHIVNAVYVFGIMACVYPMIRMAGGSRALGAMALAFIAGSPSVLTMLCTQYYVELIGAFLCTAAGFLMMCRSRGILEGFRPVGWAYFLLGVAFYSYFNYVFFLPGLLLAHFLLLQRTNTDTADIFPHLLRACLAFAAGCSLYFIGYTQIMLHSLQLPGALIYGFAAVFFAVLLTGNYICKTKSLRTVLRYTAAAAVILALWAALVFPHLTAHMDGLDVAADKSSVVRRVSNIVTYIYQAVVGTYAEIRIYGEIHQQYTRIPFAAFLLIMGCGWLHSLWKRMPFDRLSVLMVSMGIYALCGVLFGSRMQAQHFMILCFLFILAVAFTAVKVFSSKGNHLLKRITAALCVFVIALNVVNQTRVLNRIEVTGGLGLFSSQINTVAYDANHAREDGVRQTYIFKDWGFAFGFCYLTKNQISTSMDLSEEFINERLEMGHTVVSCYWNPEEISVYEDLLTVDDSKDTAVTDVLYERTGEVAFYRTSVTRTQTP